MDKLIKDEELQTRRAFFKNAAKATLPILAVAALGGSLLTSCDPDSPNTPTPSGCGKSCSGSCEGSCSGGCDTSCAGSCFDNCAWYQN